MVVHDNGAVRRKFARQVIERPKNGERNERNKRSKEDGDDLSSFCTKCCCVIKLRVNV